MNRKEFSTTRVLFDEALARTPQQRRAFLERACGSDKGLLDRVERLLRHAEADADAGAAATEADAPGASVGMPAPDFELPSVSAGRGRATVALSDFRGQWLVLIFYPRDFSLICPTELTALSARTDGFTEAGASVLGISVDSVDSHERWLRMSRGRGGLGGLNFPLASDDGAAVSRAYGVYLDRQHVALRGVFIIDPNGILQYQAVHNLSVGRRTDDVFRVLSALQTGGLCAEDWTPGVDTVDPTRALSPGGVVSHYRIEEQIGSGSFGSVFRAHDLTLERTVALKVIRQDSDLSTGAFLAEARAVAALSHVNICTVFAVDDAEGVPFIAMEYVPGRPLSELIEHRPLPPKQAADIGSQIALGMAEAHTCGIAHGDLKPANVIVRDDGVVKILDFGLARPRPPGETETRGPGSTRGLKGTPSYMSPEQANGGRAAPEGDVFSLGVMLYEMVTGDSAFPGPTIPEILEQVRTVEPQRLTDAVPEPFSGVLRRALLRDAADRTITMNEIATELGGAASSGGGS